MAHNLWEKITGKRVIFDEPRINVADSTVDVTDSIVDDLIRLRDDPISENNPVLKVLTKKGFYFFPVEKLIDRISYMVADCKHSHGREVGVHERVTVDARREEEIHDVTMGSYPICVDRGCSNGHPTDSVKFRYSIQG